MLPLPYPCRANKYASSGDNKGEEEDSVHSVDGPELGKLLQEVRVQYAHTLTHTHHTSPTPTPHHHAHTQGPYVYELFSIMVHSGSAIGGHYYAYIKSFTDKQWYCFNDQSVSKVTMPCNNSNILIINCTDLTV